MFQGVIVALVTPFKNGEVDWEALEKLVAFHLEKGTDAILPMGTTGESATVSDEEHDRIVAAVVKQVAGRVPVIAGAGANATAKALRHTRAACDAGADAVLHVTPYYNKPSQDGLYNHFETLAREGGLPVILYNVPGRTSVDLKPETVQRLAAVDGIVAVKEASGSVDRVSELHHLCPDFTVLSGDDSLTLPMLSVGAKGVISVAANIVPDRMKDMLARFARGDVAGAAQAHASLYPIMKGLFVETNPVPVKEALAMMGMIGAEVRQPLALLAEGNREILKALLAEANLI